MATSTVQIMSMGYAARQAACSAKNYYGHDAECRLYDTRSSTLADVSLGRKHFMRRRVPSQARELALCAQASVLPASCGIVCGSLSIMSMQLIPFVARPHSR